ncbi:hypothetical protein GCM10027452_08040 [Micromonospora halotolerans]
MSGDDAASQILREAGLTPTTAPVRRTQQPVAPAARRYAGGRPGTPLSASEKAHWSRFREEIDTELTKGRHLGCGEPVMGAPKLYDRSLKVPVTTETWSRVELVTALRGKGRNEACR